VHIPVGRLTSGRATAFPPGNASHILARFEGKKKKIHPFLKQDKNKAIST